MPTKRCMPSTRRSSASVLFALVAFLALLGAACGSGSDTAVESSTTVVDAGESTTSSAGGETTTSTADTPVAGDTTAGDTTTTALTDREAALAELEWTVVAVDWDDVLNVRADPDAGADIVGTLEPWSQAFVGSAVTETVGGALWRRVTLDDGAEGWVNARYIVAQPASLSSYERDLVVDATANLVYWALGTGDHDPAPTLADRALWVGGIGVYADMPLWNWIPAAEADSAEEWNTVRTFEFTGEAAGFECGSYCDKSITEFLHLHRLGDDWSVVLDDHLTAEQNGFTDGAFFQAPDSLHRVVIDKPASEGTDADGNPMIELDWQRIHVVHDWSADPDGDPRLFLVHTWGWTP